MWSYFWTIVSTLTHTQLQAHPPLQSAVTTTQTEPYSDILGACFLPCSLPPGRRTLSLEAWQSELWHDGTIALPYFGRKMPIFFRDKTRWRCLKRTNDEQRLLQGWMDWRKNLVQKPNSWRYCIISLRFLGIILRVISLSYTIFTLQTSFKPLLLFLWYRWLWMASRKTLKTFVPIPSKNSASGLG